jgi:hypothetical protein
MTRTLPTLLLAAAAAWVITVLPLPVAADPLDEPLEIDRGANPDASAQQTYQAALETARRRLQKRLVQCDQMQEGDRAECRRVAQDLHDTDVQRASDVLHRPR